jgi:hypothetical protein
MAFTDSDVEALEEAIRAAIEDGSWRVQTVQIADQAVTLRSLKEATDFLASVKTLSGGTRTRFAAFDKGL